MQVAEPAVSNKTAKVASKAMSAKAKAAKAVMDAQNALTEGKKSTRVPKEKVGDLQKDGKKKNS